MMTLDPTTRVRSEEPPLLDPSSPPPRIDGGEFVDPDDDEDCRAGLVELGPRFGDDDGADEDE